MMSCPTEEKAETAVELIADVYQDGGSLAVMP